MLIVLLLEELSSSSSFGITGVWLWEVLVDVLWGLFLLIEGAFGYRSMLDICFRVQHPHTLNYLQVAVGCHVLP